MSQKNLRDVTGGLGQFKSIISSHPGLVAVHFWADWAPQCEPMDEAIKILAKEPDFARVLFLRVEAENEADISMEYEVAAVPTFVFFGHENKVVGRIEGAKVSDVTKMIRELQADYDFKSKLPKNDTSGKVDVIKDESVDLNTRLKNLINASPAMLFMKGSPGAPECGFSRQTIDLLTSMNAEFGYFDILRDNEVRQGLKEYSKWPTYPQLYINGELIGGLDILKELNESGELEKMLPKKKDLNEILKGLINKAPLMIFMKGSPSEPRCGFSRQLMEIIKPIGIPFQTFDILNNEEVRQGLKEFSKWPTYPQIYVKGELIGGLDIIKELKESGDLESTLKGA